MRNWPSRLALLMVIALVITASVAFATSEGFRYGTAMVMDALLFGYSSDSDREQSQAIADAITRVHRFEHNSISEPNRPPVFFSPGSKFLLTKPIKVTVYDIRDKAEQDHVVAAVRTVVSDRHTPPVNLHFLDHENWTMSENYGERGPETQIRCVRIDGSSARDREGEKLITYQSP